MRFVFVTDSHIANDKPSSRFDNYNEAIFNKWEFVCKYAEKEKIKNIVFGGDLCHTHKLSTELMNRFISMIQQHSVNFYYILGNHDMQTGNDNYVDKTNVGFLSKAKCFYPLDTVEPIRISNCYITGINYTKAKSADAFFSWRRDFSDFKPEPNIPMVLVIHAGIADRELKFKGKIACHSVDNIETDADLLLCGHYHLGSKIKDGTYFNKNYRIVVPGSMARVAINEGKHKPKLVDVSIGPGKLKTKLITIPHLSYRDVFDIDTKEEEKIVLKKKEQFIETLSRISGNKLMGDNFSEAMISLFKKPPKELREIITKPVRILIKKKIAEYVK